MSSLLSWLDTALDFVFPRTCVGCNTPGTVCCPTCWQRWESQWVEHQPVPELDQLLSFGAYKAVFIQKLIQRWKFEGDVTTAATLAQLMSAEMQRWLNHAPAVLVPIPLHARKFRERGFNQTQDLAQHLSYHLNLPWLPLLQRTTYTRPQKSLEEHEKLLNVQEAFHVDRRVLSQVNRNTPVLILDDIFTTGSTLNSAAACLRRAGLSTISAAVVARG